MKVKTEWVDWEGYCDSGMVAGRWLEHGTGIWFEYWCDARWVNCFGRPIGDVSLGEVGKEGFILGDV